MGPKVLVVDDDPAMIHLLRHYLRQEGYEVLVAGDGEQGLEVLRECKPVIALVDWRMPVMDGIEMCRRVKADPALESVYFIVLTAAADEAHVVEALDSGADEYMSKPFRRAELVARIRAGQRIVKLQSRLVERYQIERERDSLRDAVKAMEQVIGVVGHELRTPLAGIRGLSEYLLTEDARQSADGHHFLKMINEEVVRMAGTVNNLLEVARITSGSAKWDWSIVPLVEVCHEAMNTLRPQVDPRQVALLCEVRPPDVVMSGDRDAIRRLIINLLNNAHKHTASGSIELTATEVHGDEGRWIQLTIQDTGCGIAPEIATRLGVAFALNSGVVGENHVRGTGLGLSICKGIAAAHGGAVAISSAVGTGTTLTVRLRADLAEPAEVPDDMEIIKEIAR